MQRSPGLFVALLTAALSTQCKKDAERPPHPTAKSARARGTAPDRLSPGELAAGTESLFGLAVPRGLSVTGKFKDSGIAIGSVDAEAVANYVRDHVAVERVEIGPSRTIFPGARIQGSPDNRLYYIEVFKDGAATRLTLWDVTPPPPPPPIQASAPSGEELWRRAGYSRSGKPLDPKALE